MKLEAYETGVTKHIAPNGVVTLRFLNGDVKTMYPDHSEHYVFRESGVEVKRRGDQVVETFPDGQIVTKTMGRTVVAFPDGTVKTCGLGYEEITYPDGRTIKSRI